jgi:cullin 4
VFAEFIQMRLHEEHERCIIYLEANTRKPLITTAEKQLLERHTSAIVEKVTIMPLFPLFVHFRV